MKATSFVRGFAMAMAAAPWVYVLAECFERASGPVDDPAGIIWVDHSYFLGRITVVAFVVGLSTLGASALDARWPVRTPAIVSSLALASTLAMFAATATMR